MARHLIYPRRACCRQPTNSALLLGLLALYLLFAWSIAQQTITKGEPITGAEPEKVHGTDSSIPTTTSTKEQKVCSVGGEHECSADGHNSKGHRQEQQHQNNEEVFHLQAFDRYGVVRQEVDTAVQLGISPDLVRQRLRKMQDYMRDEVFVNERYEKVRDKCLMQDKMCAIWAIEGECEKNPKYMRLNCAPVCMACEYLLFDERCGFDPDTPTVWGPGDVHAFFVNLTTSPFYQQYLPRILSQPTSANTDDAPWIVVLDDFLTEAECNELIRQGHLGGFQRSAGFTGKIASTGAVVDGETISSRTSTNSWCLESCMSSPAVDQVIRKIENLTMLPAIHSEHLQLLRYEEGQRYATHHDYIAMHKTQECGPRILTIFLYLNDVPQGGATRFSTLQSKPTVLPKKGRALIWPSVLNADPIEIDTRTYHEALPPEEGIKYGANAWFHQRPFVPVYDKGCI